MKTCQTALLALGLLLSLAAVAEPAAGERGPGDRPPQMDDAFDSPVDQIRGRLRAGPPRAMDDEELAVARQVIAELYPEVGPRLDQLAEEDPGELRRTLQRRFPRVRFLMELRERDPQMYELRLADIRLGRATAALAQQLREARAADDKPRHRALMDELEEQVAEHFDVRQTIRELEIEKLRQRLAELEEQLEERDDERDDLIEQRVGELAGPDW
jgi:hypothetical protein